MLNIRPSKIVTSTGAPVQNKNKIHKITLLLKYKIYNLPT